MVRVYEVVGASILFVRVPGEKGRYVRVESVCVIEVACPACKSPIGEPCKGPKGYSGMTHYKRRHLATAERRTRRRKKIDRSGLVRKVLPAPR